MNPFNPIDSLTELLNAGFTSPQALAQMQVLYGLITQTLVTKNEFNEAITTLEHKIELVRRDMTIRFGLIAATVGAGVVGALTFVLR